MTFGSTNANYPGFKVKDENIEIIELSIKDVPEGFDESSVKSINDEFIDTTIRPILNDRAGLCPCMVGKYHRKVKDAQRITGVLNTAVGSEFLDGIKFTVNVLIDAGVYKEVASVVSQCKNCGNIHIWAEGYAVARALANVEMESICAGKYDKIESENKEQPLFVTENLETGEITDVTDTMLGIIGGNSNSTGSDGIVLSKI